MKQIVVGSAVVQVLTDALFSQGLCTYFVNDQTKRDEQGMLQVHCQKGVRIGQVELVDREAYKEGM